MSGQQTFPEDAEAAGAGGGRSLGVATKVYGLACRPQAWRTQAIAIYSSCRMADRPTQSGPKRAGCQVRGTLALLLVATASLVVVPSTLATTPADPCAEASRLLKSGAFAKAEEAYRALAEAEKECAGGELTALAARRLAVARALARNGDYAEALKQLNAALELDPVLVVPGTLRRVAEAQRGFAAARQLDAGGFHGAGVKLARDTHRQYSEIIVPADTRALIEHAENRPTAWLSDKLKRYEFPLKTLGLAIVVALALWVLLYLVVRYVRVFLNPRLVFSKFTGGVKGDEPALSEGLALEAQQAVRRLHAAHGSAQRIDFASAAHSELKVPATLAGLPHFGFVAAILELLQLLFPLRDLTLSGHLQPAEPAGAAAISIALGESNGRLFDDTTLKGSAYGSTPSTAPEETYRRLIMPAAVWTLFAVARQRKRPNPLQLRDWRGYALFATAVDWHQNGAVDSARKLYLRALGLDPSILRAELNLGLVDIRRGGEKGDEEVIKRGLERLRRVRDARDTLA